MCNDAMMTVLQALIINTPTSGSQLLRTVMRAVVLVHDIVLRAL